MASQVPEIKQLRQDIDGILQRVKELNSCVEVKNSEWPKGDFAAMKMLPTNTVKEKLTEAGMWLGQCLKAIGEADPYPHSRDATSPIIEPTADNLKY